MSSVCRSGSCRTASTFLKDLGNTGHSRGEVSGQVSGTIGPVVRWGSLKLKPGDRQHLFLHALLHGATVAAPNGMLRRECRVLALVGVTVAAGIFPNGRVMHIEMSAPCGTVRQGFIRKKPSSFHCCSWGLPNGTVMHMEVSAPCGTVRQGFSPKKPSSSHCCSWGFPNGTVMQPRVAR